MSRLVVELPGDRSRCGRIELLGDQGETICGPFAVAGRSSSVLAARSDNRTRFSLLPYGDTPTGNFVIRARVPTGKGTPFPSDEFGSAGALVLEGITGDAALADANGRFSFLLQGGNLSADGRLRSTAGSLRMANADLRALLRAVVQASCKSCGIVEDDHFAGESVFDDDRCALLDPPPSSLTNPPKSASSRLHLPSRGKVLMVMGASFVAQSQANAAPVREAFVTPPRAPAPRDVHFVPLAASAAGIGQAYNPPPDATQEQQAPPAGAKCFDNCEQGSAAQQVQGLGTGQINPSIFDQGPGSTLNQSAPGGTVSVPAVSSGTAVQPGSGPAPQTQAPAPPQQSPSVPQTQSTPGDRAMQIYQQNVQKSQEEYNQHLQQLPPGTLTNTPPPQTPQTPPAKPHVIKIETQPPPPPSSTERGK